MFMLVRFGPKQNNEKVELLIFTHMKRWLCRRTTCDRKLFNIWHKTKVVDSFLEWHSVSWATWCEWLLFWPRFCPTAASKNRRPTFWRIKKKTGLEWRKLQTRLLSFHTQVCWLPTPDRASERASERARESERERESERASERASESEQRARSSERASERESERERAREQRASESERERARCSERDAAARAREQS